MNLNLCRTFVTPMQKYTFNLRNEKNNITLQKIH